MWKANDDDYYNPKNGEPGGEQADAASKGETTRNLLTKKGADSGTRADVSINNVSGERVSDMGYFESPSATGGSPSLENIHKEPLFKINKSLMGTVDKDPWYHGILPPVDVDELLVNQGDFLLRQFDAEQRGFQMAMSIRWDKLLWHFPMYSLENNGRMLYTLNNDNYFNTPTDVARYHLNKSIPVFDNVTPLTPILRQAWELRKEHIRLNGKIGEGAFGEVWSGYLQMKKNNNMTEVEVAVKLMKVTDQTRPQLEKMHQEARFLRQYNHHNVVRLHGCLFSESDVFIVMEMVKGGALDSYVKKNPNLPPTTRASYAYDVAAGLAYLHRKNCMHRDIAARNCLVEEEGKVVKLSDFGLSMHGRRIKMSETERVPIRWSAPEVLVHRVYTRESDVWSYGMLVWEIFNDGKEPFHGFDNGHIRTHICQKTFRPPIDHINWFPELATVCTKCWDVDTTKRPKMDRVAQALMKFCMHEIMDDQKKERVIVRAKEAQTKQAKMRRGKGSKDGSAEKVKGSAEKPRKQNSKDQRSVQKNSSDGAGRSPSASRTGSVPTTPLKRKKASNEASRQVSVQQKSGPISKNITSQNMITQRRKATAVGNDTSKQMPPTDKARSRMNE